LLFSPGRDATSSAYVYVSTRRSLNHSSDGPNDVGSSRCNCGHGPRVLVAGQMRQHLQGTLPSSCVLAQFANAGCRRAQRLNARQWRPKTLLRRTIRWRDRAARPTPSTDRTAPRPRLRHKGSIGLQVLWWTFERRPGWTGIAISRNRYQRYNRDQQKA
jgi:hypothetical protein